MAIARAFAGDPRIVVCDEPTSALDVSVQAAILNLLVDLQTRQQVSYIFISHDLGVVRYLADRIAVLYLGRLMEIGPAEQVFAGPHHPYTEALLSAMPAIDDRDRAHSPVRARSRAPSRRRPDAYSTRAARASSAQSARSRSRRCSEIGPGHAIRCHIPAADLARRADWRSGSHRRIRPLRTGMSALCPTQTIVTYTDVRTFKSVIAEVQVVAAGERQQTLAWQSTAALKVTSQSTPPYWHAARKKLTLRFTCGSILARTRKDEAPQPCGSRAR